MSKKHTILNEKYRPDTLEGYVCRDEDRIKFQEFIDNQDVPHLLFAGKPGAGKTTLAKILVKSINCDYLYINRYLWQIHKKDHSIRPPNPSLESPSCHRVPHIVTY